MATDALHLRGVAPAGSVSRTVQYLDMAAYITKILPPLGPRDLLGQGPLSRARDLNLPGLSSNTQRFALLWT